MFSKSLALLVDSITDHKVVRWLWRKCCPMK